MENNNSNNAGIPGSNSNYNLKINYEPLSLSERVKQRRLKLTNTKLGDQFNEETQLGRLGKDEQKDL